MLKDIRSEIAQALSDASGVGVDCALASIENGKFGDLSSKLAFDLARERKENPVKLAAEIAGKLQNSKPETVDRIEAMGPYINIFLSDSAYADFVREILSCKEMYGSGPAKPNSKTIIEFPSVNPNKPWHIGHLRNALLGESVARILEFDGVKVERIDYIDDLGLQVAQSLWGYKHLNNKVEGKFDLWLGMQYVEVSTRFESDTGIQEEVRELLKQMEEGGNSIALEGRALAERCIRSQYETAFAFGVFHDALVFESDILHTIFHEGIERIKKNDAVVLEEEGKNKGCLVVKLGEEFEKEFGKMENPDKILIRSDGTAVYTGKDVIFHLWKFGKLDNDFVYEPFISQPNGKVAYKSVSVAKGKTDESKSEAKTMGFGHATSVINVIGVEQKYPQRVIVEVLRNMNYASEAARMHHLAYEHVGLPDEKFSGRKGTWVGFTADELLAEAKQRVMEKIKVEVDELESVAIAAKVGVGAIKYAFLKIGSEKRITFKWEEALNMEGDSGPYIQYAYVRTKGILGKAKEEPRIEMDANAGDGAGADSGFVDGEKALIKRLSEFPDIVSKAAREMSPQGIAMYAVEIASEFSRFYNSCPVLIAEDARVRQKRLAITQASGITLKNALYLLGIECPDRM